MILFSHFFLCTSLHGLYEPAELVGTSQTIISVLVFCFNVIYHFCFTLNKKTNYYLKYSPQFNRNSYKTI